MAVKVPTVAHLLIVIVSLSQAQCVCVASELAHQKSVGHRSQHPFPCPWQYLHRSPRKPLLTAGYLTLPPSAMSKSNDQLQFSTSSGPRKRLKEIK